MLFSVLFILLITFGIGLPLGLLIAPKHNIVGRLGLSYLLGMGIFTLLMFVTNLLGLKITLINNILLFLAVATPLVVIGRKRMKSFWKELRVSYKNFHPDLTEKAGIAAIAFFVISSFASTFYWPVYTWDALTLYDFRAHVFTQMGFIKSALSSLDGGYYLSYPLLTSLTHTAVYLSGGNDPQFIYSLFYLSLGLVFYGQLCEFVSRKISLLFTLILLTIPQIFNQSIVSYTNLPFMTFFSLGAIYFYIWDKKRTSGYLILAAILVGFSTWTRSTEPFWLGIFVLVVLISVFRKKFLDILTFSVFFLPIQQIWKIFLAQTASQGNTLSQVIGYTSILVNIFNFQRWGTVINFLYQSVFRPWGPVFILFVAVLIYSILVNKLKETFLIYSITLALLALLLVGTFIFSFTFPTWNQIPDSASRTAMIFYPLFAYSIALLPQ